MYSIICRWAFLWRLILCTGALGLAGCASVNFDHSIARTNQVAADFTQGQLALAQTREQREAHGAAAAQILKEPLSQTAAVRLALVNSPALQGVLAQSWAQAASAAQSGRMTNPALSLERIRFADELEIGRLLSFGLLDLLTLPQRHQVAQHQLAQAQLRLTSSVIEHVTQVRQAWVKAVAAQQTLVYSGQIQDAAEASAELARRMQAVGNFNTLQRARQQAFHADAVAKKAIAEHASLAAREDLVRLLGLRDDQAAQLVLPSMLPDLPAHPRTPQEVSQQASSERLDIQLAQSEYAGAAKAQGLQAVTRLTDIELGIRRDTVFDPAAGTTSPRRGYEISLRLPIFDWGDQQRAAMNAQTLAAANRLEATIRAAGPNLRESYSAYRTAYDVAKHFRDVVVPLRKTMSEENLLRYNAMQIGVFELLSDSRDQINAVMAAMAAEQQFWLADAALQAALMGKPTTTTVGAMSAVGSQEAGH